MFDGNVSGWWWRLDGDSGCNVQFHMFILDTCWRYFLISYLKKKSTGLKFNNYSTLRKTDVTFTCDPTHAPVTHKSKSCFQTAAVAVTVLTQWVTSKGIAPALATTTRVTTCARITVIAWHAFAVCPRAGAATWVTPLQREQSIDVSFNPRMYKCVWGGGGGKRMPPLLRLFLNFSKTNYYEHLPFFRSCGHG